jgi:hypothetical protein
MVNTKQEILREHKMNVLFFIKHSGHDRQGEEVGEVTKPQSVRKNTQKNGPYKGHTGLLCHMLEVEQ